jgi:DNA repair photolyase
MRWESQRAGNDPQQALLGLDGLVRSVRSPEFQGVTFHEVRARSVLNRVPGQSVVPFRWTVNPYRGCSHACAYCLAGDTPILMGDGRTKSLAELKVGDEIYGTQVRGAYRRYVRTAVLAHWRTVKPGYRLRLADGTQLIASGDHRFLSDRGWRYVTGPARPHLTTGTKLMGTGQFAPSPVKTAGYRAGYLCGIRPVTFPLVPGEDWQKGFLAGIFDAEGSYARGILEIPNADPETIDAIGLALKGLDFRFVIEDRHPAAVHLLGGPAEHLRFFHTVDPAITWKRSIEGTAVKSEAPLDIVSVEPVGMDLPLFDITTGTGDFIANGVVSHNCFARNTHTYLEFDAGKDFDTQVVVKINAPEVLAAQLRKKSWTREHVAMGTNTDPYQRAEGRYRLMPGIIRALADSGTPFSILTKGTMLNRDVPLLQAVSNEVDVGVAVSIALLDREIQRRVEPGTPGPQARLELVRRLRDAGLPCGVMVAPVLPGLTDSTEQLDALLAEIADAGATSATVLALHLRPGAREWYAQWVAREHPELVPRYREIYGRGSYASGRYQRLLTARVGPLLRRHGFARDPSEANPRVPNPREEDAVPEQEQLKLL